MGTAVTDAGTKGWLVAILELGAWFGVLVTGYLADKLSRKYTIILGIYNIFLSITRRIISISAVVIFCIGVIVQSAAFKPASIFGGMSFHYESKSKINRALSGRFVTGLGVGSLSMAVPLYKLKNLNLILLSSLIT